MSLGRIITSDNFRIIFNSLMHLNFVKESGVKQKKKCSLSLGNLKFLILFSSSLLTGRWYRITKAPVTDSPSQYRISRH